MADFREWIAEYWNINQDLQGKLFYSLLALLVIAILRYASIKLIDRNAQDIKDRYYWIRAIKYTYGVLFILLIILIWLTEVRSLATVIGLITAGLAIALKDPIVNAAGWLFILIRKPFVLGDRIQIGSHSGDVIDVRVFQFTINEIGNWVDADQSTGRIIHIPNGKVFTEAQANFTQGFSHIWNEIAVLVTFESNWQDAKEILHEISEKHAAHFTKAAEQKLLEASRKFMILYNKLTPIVYTTVKDSGVMLTIRYLITPRRRRSSEQAIWEDILIEFGKRNDIDFAYPTQRIYYNLKEGKEGARAEDKGSR